MSQTYGYGSQGDDLPMIKKVGAIVRYPILFKYTQMGQVQQWEIKIQDDFFWTEEGIQGGTITTSKPTYCKPKNVGRSNETTAHSQALAEAKAKWQKKVDSGYNE